MKKFFNRIKQAISPKESEYSDETKNDYLELDTASAANSGTKKITVRPFTLEDFADVKEILDALREGYTIALVNIRPLKEKDMIELKRSINKLKKTCDAMEGEIAGFGEDYIVIAPNFVQIYKPSEAPADTSGGVPPPSKTSMPSRR